MKTKLFLLLTAAMLLLSVNVSAQTKKAAEKKAVKTEKRATAKKAPAGTPLKGDVNEDGVVDVADIAAVIAIMKNGGGTGEETKYYWYVGTTKPTSLSQASTVTSYPEELTYTNNSGAKSHIFVLTNSNKNVTFINLATGNPVDQNEVDTTTISGYKIFETAVGTANTGTIKIRISSTYYWYVGTTPVDDTNYTSISSSVTEIPASTNVTLNTDDYLYIVAPKTKTVTVLDANTQGVVNIKTYNSETHTFTYAETFVGDYKIYRSAQTCLGPFIINISDTNSLERSK